MRVSTALVESSRISTFGFFIIAQRVASVQDADRIIVMEGGRISDIGTHDELLNRNEIYREIYTTQNKAGDQNGEE